MISKIQRKVATPRKNQPQPWAWATRHSLLQRQQVPHPHVKQVPRQATAVELTAVTQEMQSAETDCISGG